MDRILVAIGGGELRKKETLKIDAFISELVKKRVGERRATALFIGTASHDSMPYYNSFHKTYTGELGLKTDCVLSVYGEMDDEKIKSKFEKVDVIYVGGGDTLFMLDLWKKKGVDKLIIEAYKRGVILCGLSAGAICWFENMFTDSAMKDDSGKYDYAKGMGLIRGTACPHYNFRREDIFTSDKTGDYLPVCAIEDNSAVVFENEELKGRVSCEGRAYIVKGKDGSYIEELIGEYSV